MTNYLDIPRALTQATALLDRLGAPLTDVRKAQRLIGDVQRALIQKIAALDRPFVTAPSTCTALSDAWVPGAGGTERPFTTRGGLTLLWCYQASTGRHAYINVETDVILSDAEADAALGGFEWESTQFNHDGPNSNY